MRWILPMTLLLLAACEGGSSDPAESLPEPPEIVLSDPVGVVAVIDGDTLLVARGSDVFKVRLRGVDTPELNPESSKPAEALAEEAREFALMAAGLEVGLEFDAACTPDLGPGCVDIYDRPLAYIRLKDGDDLGEALLLAGYAKILVFHDQPFDRLDAYVEAQSAAQSAGLGLWAP